MPNPLGNTPPRVVIAGTVSFVVLIIAEVVLIVEGHAAEAIALPGVVAAIIPALLGQSELHAKASDVQDQVTSNTDKLDSLLNGGTEAAVRKVVRTELASLVATDEKDGTTTVADAGAALPGAAPIPPFTAPAGSAGTGPEPPAGGHYAG